MTILFDSTRRVKATRRNFACGLARPNRERVAPYTAADLAWAAANLNANTRTYEVVGPADSLVDQGAGEAAAVAALEAGYCPF